jgi:hypothetical protein
MFMRWTLRAASKAQHPLRGEIRKPQTASRESEPVVEALAES